MKTFKRAAALALAASVLLCMNIGATTCVCSLAVNALAFAVISIAPYKSILIYSPDLLRSYTTLATHMGRYDFGFLPLAIVILLTFCVFSLNKGLFDNIDLKSHNMRSKKTKILFQDTRPIFHTYKNTLLSIDFLTKAGDFKAAVPRHETPRNSRYTLC